MERGTTPVHTFTLPFDVSTLKDLKVTYVQNKEIKLTKRLLDCMVDGQTISYKLTQAETFIFDASYKVHIQLRGLDFKGNVIKSKIIEVSVGKCLDCEVLK